MELHLIGAGLAGGALIGLAAGALLILNGRIAGISGIVGWTLAPRRRETGWRIAFVLGLLAGGGLLSWLSPTSLPLDHDAPYAMVLAAGLLVGFGSRLGTGCTSGHGVCGIGRLSPRSLVATATFVLTGMLTVAAARYLGGM